MATRDRKLLLAIGVLSVVMLAGCGSGADDSATGAKLDSISPEFARYLKRADAACKGARVGLEEEVAEFVAGRRGQEKARPVYLGELARYVFLPKVEEEMEAVRALGAPPPGEEQLVNHLLYMKEVPINEVATSSTVASLDALDEQFVKSERLFQEYGMSSCARGPEAQATAGPLILG